MEKYTIDFVSKAITITAKFAAKAQDITSEEFKLLDMMSKNGYKTNYKTHKTPKKYKSKCGEVFKKNQYKDLTYENMGHFLFAMKNNAAIEEFAELTALASHHRKGYAVVRDWFLALYPDYRTEPMKYLEGKAAAPAAVKEKAMEAKTVLAEEMTA